MKRGEPSLPRLKPMLPTLSSVIPEGAEWLYEPKYDGYRALVYWLPHTLQIYSRNGHPLGHQFPEMVSRFTQLIPSTKGSLPLILDGELTLLKNRFQSDFALLQRRGRLRSAEKIKQWAEQRPVAFICFDLLYSNGEDLRSLPYINRKERLKAVLPFLITPLQLGEDWFQHPRPEADIFRLDMHKQPDLLWKQIVAEHGEGIVAKRRDSTWQSGKRSQDWIKVKNYMIATCFIMGYEKQNGYFQLGVLKDGGVHQVGLLFHGLTEVERSALLQIIKKNKNAETETTIMLNPALCVDVKYLNIYEGQLREPRFSGFRPDVYWEECTWQQLIQSGRRST